MARMIDLFHNVPINAAPEKIYAAIATEAGMQGWWTRDTVMDARVGGKVEFGFDRRGMTFRMTITELAPNRAVRMSCSGDHPEWANTTLEWTIEQTGEGSVLRFLHRGWRERSDFCASCNSMWGQLMFRLKGAVESGRPNPQWTE
jgi:uncharacterized protein YndB with AHSA1/START domain